MRRCTLLALPTVLALAATPAFAFQASPVSSGGLQSAPRQNPVRHEIAAYWGAPPSARRAAWQRLLRDTKGRWQALWDRDTGAPLRIIGSGIPAKGATYDSSAALAHAREHLVAWSDLLAPGTRSDDFELAANDLDRELRTVAFSQRARVEGHSSVPVIGARLSFRFKNDRLFAFASESLPISDALPAPTIAPDTAERAASDFTLATHKSATLLEGATLAALPLVGSGRAEIRLVHRVIVDAFMPRARYAVYIDARSGEPIAHEQLLRFASAQLRFDVPQRSQLLGRAPYPAALLDIDVDGEKTSADPLGAFTYTPSGPGTLSLFARGQKVAVNNGAGTTVAQTMNVTDGAQLLWSLANDEFGDAQLSAYIHTGIAKERAALAAPQMAFIGQTLQVNANVADAIGCNAFWDGTRTNFFRENPYCNNTARVADVVYHEFGHAFHQHAILAGAGALDPALGEGAGDVMSSMVTGDPKLAPGFFMTMPQAPLRELDTGRKWPDDIDSDPHETGLIFAGAMWDLRSALIASLGPSEGEARADMLFYQALRRSSNIPSSYAEVLVADDNDGDLSNGTPNICAINRAFIAHGLAPVLDESGLVLSHEPLAKLEAGKGPYPVRVKTTRLYPQCDKAPIDSVDLRYKSGVNNKIVPLAAEGEDFVGELASQPQGSALRYSIVVRSGSATTTLPQNPADPEYRVFAGETTTLYCNDFETQTDGWTFGGLKGYEGDFQWGVPLGEGGDPDAAFSGKRVIGNRLIGTGVYKSNRTAFATSPLVDLKGEEQVRLQFWRWLTVEDGVRDQASIYVNDTLVWQNAATTKSDGSLEHRDAEWRFEDIDLTPFAAEGQVQIRFELTSNVGGDLGGWNIDDLCVVALPSTDGAGGAGGGGTGGNGDTPVPLEPSGCACHATGSSSSSAGLAAALFALTTLFARRRRSRAQLPVKA